MDELAASLVKHRKRLNEIVEVLGRYGFAQWVSRDSGLAGLRLNRLIADPALARLSEGERLRRALVELGTTWMKFGQMLSLRADIVGPDVAAELEKLQADVPPDPPDVARRMVESELGAPVGELFARFEDEPFGSGSVAQVHRATLHDGTEVAVKVLHAGADRKVLADLELMGALARHLEAQDAEIAQYRPTVLVDEFQKMMHGSINLGQELANLQRFTADFADEPDVVIPTPHPELSSSRVATMALLSGQPFTRDAIVAAGWDVDDLVRRAADIYLEMIFRDGVYHADPHPGNFLVLDGKRLGILDFGDVGYVTDQRRDQLENLVIAIGTRDVDDLTDIVLQMTTPPADVDPVKLRGDIDLWLNRYFLGGVAELDVAAITTSGMALMHDHKLVLPADLALLFRVLLRLQGLGRGVGTQVRVTELLEPYVKKMMVERFNPKRMAHNAVRTMRKWDHLIEALPEELLATLERFRTGDVGIDFRFHDEDHVVDGLVDGLFASASLLAASQLLSRRTGPVVAGISVPGAVAVGVGVITWRRLAAKRAGHRSVLQKARSLSGVGV